MLFGDDANPVGVGEERVVERGEELRRGGSVGVWQRSAGHVEQLTTALVAEGDERGRSRSKISPSPQARPRPRVGDGGRTECPKVPHDELVWSALAGDAPAQPRFCRSQDDRLAVTPDAAGRHVHQRQQAAYGGR